MKESYTVRLTLTLHAFPLGPVFGNMNQFVGLGIFVDTYPNADRNHDVSDSWKLSYL